MIEVNLKQIVESLIDTFISVGKISLELRKKGLTKEIKSDNTPVTNADLEVNKLLTKKLIELTPDFPIVSEETSDNKSIENLKNFWLVDPIDGTYDYINNKDEFTINAGLIMNRRPVAGLINAPAQNRMFYSYGKGLAFEITKGELIKLNCKKKTSNKSIKVVCYSTKLNPEIEKKYKEFGVTENIRMKSSLKFCVIAAGEYDGYIAEPRASEWDIAAGHAILKDAGGIITDFDNNEILYGKKNFKNPSLILRRSKILSE
tara:strand:- start:1583 stop:2362 length:780 start_codon:yes stop_codon:yes gene_type:complete